MRTATQTALEIDTEKAARQGCVIRCHAQRSVVTGSKTHARIAGDVARQGARRIGTVAILTAVTVVGASILQALLQPEMAAAQQTPLFRLSALFLVLAAIALAAVQRAQLVEPQDLLDLGLVFEVAGAAALAFMDNAAPWPNGAIRGSAPVAAWIAICVVVIPNRPWKSITAAVACAATVPCAHIVAAQIIGYSHLPWQRLASYAMAPLLIAGWTPFISTRIHQLRENLSRTQEFGSYHLEKLLGRGGMGEVWLGRHHLLRRDAAVKLILPGLVEGAGASERRHIQERFESEAQAIASLRSPHTVAIYDYGVEENGSLYYVMEYLDGLDMQGLVEQYGPQPAGRVLELLGQACESLEEAHDAGLVHRDIKPSNVFLCRLGKRTDFVKLLDFGLVKELTGTTQNALTTTATSGTPAFMAPEQVRGEESDPRTDIYGVGCLAYFLLTGTLVFNKPSAIAMAVAHVSEPPEPPSRRSELPVPQTLERIVMACLEKNRGDRPQSMGQLRGMLDGCVDVARWTGDEANHWWALHRPEPVRKAS
jgi:serine/threonine-protein kinase